LRLPAVIITLIACLFAWITAHTNDNKLQKLKSRIDIEFCTDVDALSKHIAIDNLYDLVFCDTGTEAYFGKRKTVRRVLIYNPYHINTEYSALNDLRENTMLFPYDGRNSETLKYSLERFKSELKEIKIVESSLKQTFSSIEFIRFTGYLSTQYTASNRSYLDNIRAFFEISTLPEFYRELSKFDVIYINDSSFSIHQTNIKRFRSFENKETLDITFSHEGDFACLSYIDKALIKQLLDIVLVKGFQTVFYRFLTESEIKLAIDELWNFLTDEMTDFLIEHGVKQFELRDNPDVENPFNSGIITVGLSEESMEEAVKKAFPK